MTFPPQVVQADEDAFAEIGSLLAVGFGIETIIAHRLNGNVIGADRAFRAQRFEATTHVPIAATLAAMQRVIEAVGINLAFDVDGRPREVGIETKRWLTAERTPAVAPDRPARELTNYA